MKYLILLPVLLFIMSCGKGRETSYIIHAQDDYYYAKEVEILPHGIKFQDIRSGDSMEIFGSYTVTLPEKQEKVTKKNINHNDYSK